MDKQTDTGLCVWHCEVCNFDSFRGYGHITNSPVEVLLVINEIKININPNIYLISDRNFKYKVKPLYSHIKFKLVCICGGEAHP
jgi:hypothetical protein